MVWPVYISQKSQLFAQIYVNGYCCYVKTSDKGAFCGSRDDMTDDNKNEIPDDVREYVRDYLKSIGETEATTTVESITCEGIT